MKIYRETDPADPNCVTLWCYPDAPKGEPDLLPCGRIHVHWEKETGVAYAGALSVLPSAPHGAAYLLVFEAVRTLRAAACVRGVLIFTEGDNRTRRFYSRLGFRDIPECPGLKVARLVEIEAHFARVCGKTGPWKARTRGTIP